MPIYEYECPVCLVTKDVLQTIKMSQKDITTCDICEAAMHRIISIANFDLKGEGFYCNDYYRRKKNVNEP